MSDEKEAAYDETVRTAKVTRAPILISEHAVALLTIFELQYDNLDDLWSIDFLQNWSTPERAAKQFVSQLTEGGHWTPALLMALRVQLRECLREHDGECGTRFAEHEQEGSNPSSPD